MSRYAVAWLSAMMMVPMGVEAAAYVQVVKERSQVAFVSRQMGVPVEGSFRQFEAEINFDPARLEHARASIEIGLASADAGSREVDEELLGRDWFYVARYPRAQFVSTAVRALGENRYEARGKLSLKGRERSVVLPFTFNPVQGGGMFEGRFSLKRLDYGIGEGPWGDTGTVSDEVQIKFRILMAPGNTQPVAPSGSQHRRVR